MCIAKLQAGFAKVGIFQIGKNIQAFLDIFRETGLRKLTRKKLINFLKPSFSEEGFDMRLYENAAYRAFSNYIRDVASGRRSGIALANILQFCAPTDEEPPLGFAMHPSIQFVKASSPSKWEFIPSANTCSKSMTLPVPSHETPLPAEVELFEVYDYAICNSYLFRVRLVTDSTSYSDRYYVKFAVLLLLSKFKDTGQMFIYLDVLQYVDY